MDGGSYGCDAAGGQEDARAGGVPDLRRLPPLPAALAAVCLTLALALGATLARAEVRTGTIGNGCSYTLDDSGKLTIRPTDGVSGEMARIYGALPGGDDRLKAVRSVVVERGVSAPEDSSYLFEGLHEAETLDLSGLDTSRVTNMAGMFDRCSSLSSLDVSGWDTSQVTDMGGMFDGCSALSSLDVSKLDTSRVTGMGWMFDGCSALASLDVSGWDTSRVTDMGGMFHGCSALSSLDLSKLDTSRVTDMHWMFTGCSSLPSLDLSGWNTSRVTDMDGMFYGCSALSSLDVSGWDTSRVTDMGFQHGEKYGMFQGCSSLPSLDLSGWDTSQVTDMELMFYDCSSLSSLDLSGWDTSRVTKMGSMFSGCRSLASLDLSSFDTSQVTDMGGMFGNCRSLASLDLSGFDTSQVTDMRSMFTVCLALSSLDVSGWDTSRVESMWLMFGNCSSLPSLDLSGWDTSRVTGMADMFSFCSSLSSLDLSGWDTSRVTGMADMFRDCSALSSLDLSGWNTSKVTDMVGMFEGCTSLASLDLSGWDTSQVQNMSGMFVGCPTLSSITVGKGAGRMLSGEASGFPAGRDGRGWFSARDRRWFTAEELSPGRQGIADTYTTYGPGDEPKPEERDVSKASVDAIPDQAWTGSAVEPRPTVRLGGRTLSEGTDYALSFRDNTDAGTATVTIEGRGSYTGAKSVTFRIVRRDEPKPKPDEPKPNPDGPKPDPGKPQPSPDGPKPEERDVSRASVDAIPDQTFTGSPLEPRPAVRLGGRTLTEGTDYALSFGGNEGIGTATVTVTGKGAYTGAKSVTFRIGFSDVPAGHWVLTGDVGGEGYLAAVVRMGLMTGYGDPATGRLTGRFGPEDSVTRAQVVTVLYRRANPGSTDTTTGAHAENATSLSDNESGQYYTAAVNWAVRTGVVTGYTAGPDAGRFVPDREISREELATMVHRFAALEGADDSVPDSAYGGAPDAGDVSGWASGHVAWCYAHQVLTGHADTGLLEPQGTATRAQMAKMAVLTIKAMGR